LEPETTRNIGKHKKNQTMTPVAKSLTIYERQIKWKEKSNEDI